MLGQSHTHTPVLIWESTWDYLQSKNDPLPHT